LPISPWIQPSPVLASPVPFSCHWESAAGDVREEQRVSKGCCLTPRLQDGAEFQALLLRIGYGSRQVPWGNELLASFFAAQKGRAKPLFALPEMIEEQGSWKKKPRWRRPRFLDHSPQRLPRYFPQGKLKNEH